jgi:hypothetical protein
MAHVFNPGFHFLVAGFGGFFNSFVFLWRQLDCDYVKLGLGLHALTW